jgi:DNA-binding NarL/FixJ family response regulator
MFARVAVRISFSLRWAAFACLPCTGSSWSLSPDVKMADLRKTTWGAMDGAPGGWVTMDPLMDSFSACTSGALMTNNESSEVKRITVLIADDHMLLREGIAAVIQGESDMSVVAEASNGLEAVERYREYRPDVTLMDLLMPQMDGPAAVEAIRAEFPEARIVILTTYRGDAQALRALKAGASGYLLKSLIRTELLESIRSVHAGRRRIPPEIAAELAEHAADEALSDRELRVLTCVASGNSNREVAEQLSESEETVKAHMKNILSKLRAKDRTHAVTIALKRGIIQV